MEFNRSMVQSLHPLRPFRASTNIYVCPLIRKLGKLRRQFARRAETPLLAEAGSRKLPCAC